MIPITIGRQLAVGSWLEKNHTKPAVGTPLNQKNLHSRPDGFDRIESGSRNGRKYTRYKAYDGRDKCPQEEVFHREYELEITRELRGDDRGNKDQAKSDQSTVRLSLPFPLPLCNRPLSDGRAKIA